MLLPVKLPFTTEINRSIFAEIPIDEIKYTFYCFGRNTPGGIVQAGTENYQKSNYIRKSD